MGGHDIWDRLEQINRPRDPERGPFGILNVEIHLLARHRITAMGSDFNDEMLKTISLGEVFGRCEGTEVGLEAINVELLDNTGVEVPTGNIVLVMLEHFIGAAERSSKLGGQEGFLGATDVEENEVTRLVDILCCRIGGRDALELDGIATFLGS